MTRASDRSDHLDTGERHAVVLAGLASDQMGQTDHRPAVVLLHGLSFSHRIWSPVVAWLRRIDPGRRVLTLDLPGHGQSPAWAGYSVEGLADGVHRAITEAHVAEPVVVGHSMGAVIASVYGARHPARGIVNVDQPLQVAPFARLVQSLSDRLRGEAFPDVWQQFVASMHIERLTERAQDLIASTSHPDQKLVLAYWHDALTRSPEELDRWASDVLGRLRSQKVPYLVVFGDEPGQEHRQWLHDALPQARVVCWPGSGHFPHLADPRRFAELLAATGDPAGARSPNHAAAPAVRS